MRSKTRTVLIKKLGKCYYTFKNLSKIRPWETSVVVRKTAEVSG